MEQLAIVREAVSSLGLLVPGAERTIAALLKFCHTHHPREVATKYRKVGEQLPPGEKRTLDIRANAFLSRQAFAELTDRGRKIPLEAHETTLLRAVFTQHRVRAISQGRSHGYDEFKYSSAFADCRGRRRLDKKIVKGDYAQIFGPPECNRSACALSLWLHIDFLAGL